MRVRVESVVLHVFLERPGVHVALAAHLNSRGGSLLVNVIHVLLVKEEDNINK